MEFFIPKSMVLGSLLSHNGLLAQLGDYPLKMQIQVKCSCGEGECPKWAIIELQGVVEAQPQIENRLQNLEIGRLCHSSSRGNFTFTVGYHELSGTKIPLKKPLLVLKKKKVVEEDEPSPCASSRAELEIIGIIRVLFKTR